MLAFTLSVAEALVRGLALDATLSIGTGDRHTVTLFGLAALGGCHGTRDPGRFSAMIIAFHH